MISLLQSLNPKGRKEKQVKFYHFGKEKQQLESLCFTKRKPDFPYVSCVSNMESSSWSRSNSPRSQEGKIHDNSSVRDLDPFGCEKLARMFHPSCYGSKPSIFYRILLFVMLVNHQYFIEFSYS